MANAAGPTTSRATLRRICSPEVRPTEVIDTACPFPQWLSSPCNAKLRETLSDYYEGQWVMKRTAARIGARIVRSSPVTTVVVC